MLFYRESFKYGAETLITGSESKLINTSLILRPSLVVEEVLVLHVTKWVRISCLGFKNENWRMPVLFHC